MTELSLPTEYSITGRSLSATASRRIWMLSASRRCRCVEHVISLVTYRLRHRPRISAVGAEGRHDDQACPITSSP